MTELQLYKFIEDNSIEYTLLKDEKTFEVIDAYAFIPFYLIEDFANLFKDSLLLVNDSLECYFKEYFLCVKMKQVCEYFDIELENILKKNKMTAEQALIEENKKDPRVRYLSYNPHKEKIALWSEEPDFDTDDYEFWGSPSSHLGKIPIFRTPDAEYILCIDDIKPEVPPIHEKWYIECTEENRDILNEWRLRNSTSENYIGTFQRGHCLLSDSGVIKDGTLFCSKLHIESNKRAFSNYQKITLEQFKKHVLKEESEEKKEPEKQEIKSSYNPFDKSFTDSIANHPLMSIAESEREESQKEQEEKNNIFSNIFLTHQMARYFSEIGIPVYSILKNSLGLEDERVFKMVSNNEIYLKYFFVQLSIFLDKLNKENNALNKQSIESKVKEINESIENYCESWACIPTDWVEERNQLIETLNNL